MVGCCVGTTVGLTVANVEFKTFDIIIVFSATTLRVDRLNGIRSSTNRADMWRENPIGSLANSNSVLVDMTIDSELSWTLHAMYKNNPLLLAVMSVQNKLALIADTCTC
mmetsp:Transcript_7661/g.12894  ORF Transcript_7661/g.12894 Transcript_7661/m.12894 type:complete len:109 (-) Transcript_7661:334-660(-)